MYFSWYMCWLSSIGRRLINLLNYEHRKCLMTIRSPSATIVTTTWVDATILCWTKEDTSPSRLGGASKIVRYATSMTRSSYLSMHELSFCFDDYFIFYNSTSASPAMQDITSVTRSIYMIGKRMLRKKLNLRRNMVSF